MKSGEIVTVFFGGGTPSLIDPMRIGGVISTITETFQLAGDAEITLEANPDDLYEEKISAYIELGINRISLGVQSIHNGELLRLGRRHDRKTVYRVIEILHKLRIDNFSVDLIYGIPEQSLDSWRETLREVISFEPMHISTYCLTVEDNTPLSGMVREGRVSIPSDDILRNMYLVGVEMLKDANFVQYEISNFAKDGFRSRHNLGYWTGKPYLGLGPSASSYVRPERWKNVADLSAYLKCVEDSGCAIYEKENATDEIERNEFVMLSLRLNEGLNLKDYKTLFGVDLCRTHRKAIEKYLALGLMRHEDNRIYLTPSGMFVSDEIISSLM